MSSPSLLLFFWLHNDNSNFEGRGTPPTWGKQPVRAERCDGQEPLQATTSSLRMHLITQSAWESLV